MFFWAGIRIFSLYIIPNVFSLFSFNQLIIWIKCRSTVFPSEQGSYLLVCWTGITVPCRAASFCFITTFIPVKCPLTHVQCTCNTCTNALPDMMRLHSAQYIYGFLRQTGLIYHGCYKDLHSSCLQAPVDNSIGYRLMSILEIIIFIKRKWTLMISNNWRPF